MSTRPDKSLLVRDVMLPPDRAPVIRERTILKQALEEMGRSRLGIACIVNDDMKLLGILTDGDIRRKLLTVQKPFSAFFVDDALDHAIKSPLTTKPEETLMDAVTAMEKKQVWDLPVVESQGRFVGLLHLHPAIQALLGMTR
jgi:arabinose-5-phosphate isomerase